MEYVQERITTLHALADPVPDAATDRAAVVVPMTHREYAARAAERVLSELERVDPATVVVPFRAPAGRAGPFRDWLADFDLPLVALWCNGSGVRNLLSAHGLNGDAGKGRDVWLALGIAAARNEYVVVHDADAETYTPAHVSRLLWPLSRGWAFSKGYYARVEDERLYGRLFRLFYAPLVEALGDAHDHPLVEYLGAFRYALAGDIGLTAGLARAIRAQPAWGFEVGTLGDAFREPGFEGTAQVDLGTHEHDHRTVGGPAGLAEMSREVGTALFRTLGDVGIDPAYETLDERYRAVADRYVRQYAADASFNGLEYDPEAEREQIAAYADAIARPGTDARLPAWTEVAITPEDVVTTSRADLETARRT